jgi:hypothetical protein
MCKEMPVILVNRVVDPTRRIGKKWRAKEEGRHKWSLNPLPPQKKTCPKDTTTAHLTCI